ncbi:MAG: RimK family alpha-L-glutamate ligase [Candidatus Woesearchaeota archaeon]
MRAALISLGSKSSEWTADTMKKYFEVVDSIRLDKIEVHTSGTGLKVLHNKEPLGEYDCIYTKGSFRYPLMLRSITEAFYDKAYMPIEPRAFTDGRDKWLSHLVFQKAGIPMPRTFLCPTISYAKRVLEESNFPVIMKFPAGTQGKGVMFAESYAAASSTLDAISRLNQQIIIQDYIDTGGVDIRAIVCGDRVVASMKRIATHGEKRANLHAGGVGEAFEPDARIKRVAIKTAEAIGAGICGVDILESAKGPLVIEVNLSPGLQGITNVTKIDVADKIAKFLAEQTRIFLANKKGVDTNDILNEVGIDHSSKIKSIITNLDMRGERILLPENITKLTNFSDKHEYVIKFEDGELKIKRYK